MDPPGGLGHRGSWSREAKPRLSIGLFRLLSKLRGYLLRKESIPKGVDSRELSVCTSAEELDSLGFRVYLNPE